MKYLIDAQISPHFANWLNNQMNIVAYSLTYFSLDSASDIDIYHFAKENNFTIISKDYDFIDIINNLGSPPKLIYLNTGNSSNSKLKEVFSEHLLNIINLLSNNDIVELK